MGKLLRRTVSYSVVRKFAQVRKYVGVGLYASLIVALSLSGTASAAAGDFDSSFGAGGYAATGPNPTIGAVAAQPDGKVLVAGPDTSGANVVARLNGDGSVDTTFGSNGSVALAVPATSAVLVEPNNEILAVGGATTASDGETPGVGMVKLLSDGSVDSTFGSDGVSTADLGLAHFTLFGAAVDGQGNIDIFGGNFISNPSQPSVHTGQLVLAQFLPDGTLNTAFGDGGTVLYATLPHANTSPQSTLVTPEAITVTADGSIVVAVNGTVAYDSRRNLPSESYNFLMKYTSGGSLDTSFGSNGITQQLLNSGYTPAFNSTVMQSDGSIVVAESDIRTGSRGVTVTHLSQLWGYNADGSVNQSFGSQGVAAMVPTGDGTFNAQGMVMDHAGNLVVGGEEGIDSGAVVERFEANGTVEPDFGGASPVALTSGTVLTSIAVDSANNVLVDAADSVDSGAAGHVARILGSPEETVGVVPQAPATLTAATPTNHAPSLSWSVVSGAVSYNVYRDGVKVGSTSGTSFTDTAAGEGTHVYYVTAVNGVGESSASNTVNVIYDKTRPTMTFTAPTSFAGSYTAGPTVAVSAADSGSGLGIMVIHIYTSSNQLLNVCGTATPAQLAAGSMSCDLSKLAPGAYYVRAGTNDKAGNNMTINSTTFTITG